MKMSKQGPTRMSLIVTPMSLSEVRLLLNAQAEVLATSAKLVNSLAEVLEKGLVGLPTEELTQGLTAAVINLGTEAGRYNDLNVQLELALDLDLEDEGA